MELIVGLAGRRGSGKTTVAQALASRGFATTAFGDVVRREATRLGRNTNTESLQELGAELITVWGWERFCGEVLAQARHARRIAVDGFRHSEAVATFRRLFGERFRLVFLKLPDPIRYERLQKRGEFQPQLSDSHPVEAETSQLEALADAVVEVDAADPVTEIMTALGLKG